MTWEHGGRWVWWTVAALIVSVGLGLIIWQATTDDDPGAGGMVAGVTSTTTASTAAPTTTTPHTTPDLAGGAGEGGGSEGSSTLDYVIASDDLLWLMDDDHRRLMELDGVIREALPNVPNDISSELETMADDLAVAREALEALPVPTGQEASCDSLLQAAGHMEEWIDATADGVRVARETGSSGAGQVYLDEGTLARDAYEAAMVDYWMCTAPG